MANKLNQKEIKDVFYVPSDELRDLRLAIKSFPQIEASIGNAVQFRIVLDTNAVLKDLIWLSKHRKKPGARTSLLEVIDSETVKAYAPTIMLEEINRHLPRIATEESIALEMIQNEWEAYKTKLVIYDPSALPEGVQSNQADPNDRDFIALADEIKADAIFSEDRHIKRMGGHPITLDFIVNVRDYSRASALELSIKFRGVMFGVITIRILAELIKGVLALVGRIPPWLKIVLLITALGVILHPKSRDKINSCLTKASSGIKEIMPDILEGFSQMVDFTEQQKTIASEHLKTVNTKLKGTQEQGE